jgi:hypothetical protein
LFGWMDLLIIVKWNTPVNINDYTTTDIAMIP